MKTLQSPEGAPTRSPPRRIASLSLLCLLWFGGSSPTSAEGDATSACGPPGHWVDGASSEPIKTADALQRLSDATILLLGEEHDRAAHHDWQAHVLAGVHAHRPVAGVGLEMLPKHATPALQRWVDGEIDFRTFLDESEWFEAWGYDPALYRNILDWARAHRVPLHGLNVDRDVVRSIARHGWEGTDPDLRGNLERPAPAHPVYRKRLQEVFSMHGHGHGDADDAGDALERFVLAQTVWDRTMADGLGALADDSGEGEMVVGLAGRGHVEYGHGIEHQLDEAYSIRSAMPLDAGAPCPASRGGKPAADYYFILPKRPDEPTAELGIRMQRNSNGHITVSDVQSGSVAAEAGLQSGDRIIEAGGEPVRSPAELQARVRAYPAGSWMPLTIERDGDEDERIARFPPPTRE